MTVTVEHIQTDFDIFITGVGTGCRIGQLNVLAAVTMLSSFQGGDDRRELFLFSDMSAEEMRESFHREVYE